MPPSVTSSQQREEQDIPHQQQAVPTTSSSSSISASPSPSPQKQEGIENNGAHQKKPTTIQLRSLRFGGSESQQTNNTKHRKHGVSVS